MQYKNDEMPKEEYNVTPTSPTPVEFNDNDKFRTIKKSGTIATSTLLAISALLIGGGVATTSDTEVDAYIASLTSTDTQIEWVVNVEGEANDLTVEAYNDFTHRTTTIESGESSGTFDDLKEGMEYTVAVYMGDGSSQKLLTKQKIKTKRQ
ncbi:MAG: hypothetical protein ACI4MY_07450 [Christensenellales bacterium]